MYEVSVREHFDAAYYLRGRELRLQRFARVDVSVPSAFM